MPNRDREYGVPHLKTTKRGISLVARNRPVANVESAFKRIADQADHLAAQDGELFIDSRRFRYTHVNRRGVNDAKNHFQGIQRLRSGKYLVLSGGDATEPVSHVFVVHMDSRRAKGAWGTNLLLSNMPTETDKIVKIVPLDKECSHAGGLSLLGDILAVPLETSDKSRIIFLHMLDPENPTRLGCEIDRPNIGSAGAVALAKLTNGKFICAVWHEVKKKPKGRLDFYLSRTKDIRDGFVVKPDGSGLNVVTWASSVLNLDKKRDPSYQSINFIEPIEKDIGNGRTRLYMIGTENGAAAAPFESGPDLADLYEVVITNDMFASSPAYSPSLSRIETRQFFCNREYCNLDAAGGIYVDPDAGLNLYASFHWRISDTVRFAEFRSQPDPATSVITDIQKAWIDLFEDPKFNGRRLSILGNKESTIADYGKINVQGGGFDNKVSSVRFQIPRGHLYRLYRQKSFAGEQPGQDYIELLGTGMVEEIEDFNDTNRRFENKVSSSKYAR